DPSGRRRSRGNGGHRGRLLARLGDEPSLGPRRGCFGDGRDGHIPTLLLGHQRRGRAWRTVRCSRAVLAGSLGALALDSYGAWCAWFRRRAACTSWVPHPVRKLGADGDCATTPPTNEAPASVIGSPTGRASGSS